MATRQRHRTERTRVAFLRAAQELLAEKGYAATSVSDVVVRAGRAQGTFYLHFENKRDIFAALLPQLTDAVEQCSRAVSAAASAADVRQTIDRFCGVILDHRELWLLLEEMAATDAGAISVKAELRSLIESGLGRALDQFVPPADDSALKIELLAGMLLWIARVGCLPASRSITVDHLTVIAMRSTGSPAVA